MPPNNRILLYGVLRPKLFNISFASCSFINLDILLPYTTHFDDNTVLPFLVFNTLDLHFLYFLFFCTSNNLSACFIMASI